jgi:hypothetical protein
VREARTIYQRGVAGKQAGGDRCLGLCCFTASSRVQPGAMKLSPGYRGTHARHAGAAPGSALCPWKNEIANCRVLDSAGRYDSSALLPPPEASFGGRSCGPIDLASALTIPGSILTVIKSGLRLFGHLQRVEAG